MGRSRPWTDPPSVIARGLEEPRGLQSLSGGTEGPFRRNECVCPIGWTGGTFYPDAPSPHCDNGQVGGEALSVSGQIPNLAPDDQTASMQVRWTDRARGISPSGRSAHAGSRTLLRGTVHVKVR